MALYRPPIQIHVRCHMKLCNYDGKKTVPWDTFFPMNRAHDKCPRCGYFTLYQYDPIWEAAAQEIAQVAEELHEQG